jgi:putative ABC transport system permease protein
MTSSAMTAISVAMVVSVLTILLGFVVGMRRTVTLAGEHDHWVILQRGVLVESGYISHESYDILKTMPEVATDPAGNPLLSPEDVNGFDPTPDAPLASSGTLRSVLPIAYEVHPGIRVIAGHRPERGQFQWMLGQRFAARHPDLTIGSPFRWGRNNWHIVGIFSDNGSARESEVWTNLDDLAAEFHAAGTVNYNIFHVVLKPGEAESFAARLHRDNRLRVDLMSEEAFYLQAAGFSNQIRSLGLAVALVLAVGAVFGAMNTMYSAVARRVREVGTLRVLGFGRGTVLLAFVVESAVLGLAGGILGELLAIVIAYGTGLQSRLMNVGTILFSFHLDGAAIVAGIVAALAIGIVGGLLPAWQASRIPVMEALRD